MGCAVFLCVVLIGGVSRLYVLWKGRSPIIFQEAGIQPIDGQELIDEYMIASGLPGIVAASRNGTRYYYPWCGGINRIKEANKIWFESEKEAEAAGYSIASGCEGL